MTTAEYTAKLDEIRNARNAQFNSKRLSSTVAIEMDLKRESLQSLKNLIQLTVDATPLDSVDRMSLVTKNRSSKNAKEYGQIPSLIFMLCTIVAWPVKSKDDAKNIDSILEDIAEAWSEKGLTFDVDLLLDIKEAKGYHSFMADDGVAMPAVEPAYDELEYHLSSFVVATNMPSLGLIVTEEKWDNNEKKAQQVVLEEAQANELALKMQEELLNA